jgi:hypothetical protein
MVRANFDVCDAKKPFAVATAYLASHSMQNDFLCDTIVSIISRVRFIKSSSVGIGPSAAIFSVADESFLRHYSLYFLAVGHAYMSRKLGSN